MRVPDCEPRPATRTKKRPSPMGPAVEVFRRGCLKGPTYLRPDPPLCKCTMVALWLQFLQLGW